MVMPSRNTSGPVPGLSEYGTMLEIKTVQMLPDGRSMLETTGSFRFRLLEVGSLDGYTIGRIERIEDLTPEEEAALEAQAVARNARLPASASSTPPDPTQLPTELLEFAHLREEGASLGLDGTTTTPAQQAPTASSTPQREMTTAELVQTCISFIEELRSGSAPWLLARLNHTYGAMPEGHEIERLGYWMALIM